MMRDEQVVTFCDQLVNSAPDQATMDDFCRKEIGISPITHGFRVLIRAPLIRELTQGGIRLPPDVQTVRQYKENIGLVLSLGPHCFKGKSFEDDSFDKDVAPRFKPGDWVYYSSYEKEKYFLNGFLCYYMTDDRVHATIRPEDLSILLTDMY